MKPVVIKAKLKPEHPIIEAGLHPFVIQGVYHVGTIPGSGGFDAKNTLVIVFELPEVAPIESKDDKGHLKLLPRVLSKRYTLSFNSKARLRIELESLRGKPFTEDEAKTFEVQRLLGAGGQLQVMHTHKDDRTFANVNALLPAPKGVKYKGSLDQVCFSVDCLENAAELDGQHIPDWIKELVKKSEEYNDLLRNGGRVKQEAVQQPSEDPSQDDVPF